MHSRWIPAAETNLQINEVYGENMSERIVRKWARAFKDGHKNVHEKWWHSDITENLVQKVEGKVQEKMIDDSYLMSSLKIQEVFFTE